LGITPRQVWIYLLSLMTLATACASQTATLPEQADLDSAAMIQRLQLLAAPELAGRGNGTPAALVAADSIAHWFAAAGLRPGGDGGGWHQDFILRGDGLEGKPGRNVLGLVPGRGALAGRYVVVGAHYDHLGRVDTVPASTAELAEGEYFPGADDNASGVTILVELARVACRAAAVAEGETGPPQRSCLFVSFAGEEVGLQGSAYLVKHLPVPRDSLDVMINLDSLGRLREDRLFVAGVGTAAELPRLVREANQDSLQLELSRGGWDASDHVSFNTSQVPVLFLFTGAHPDYHQTSDTWPKVDATRLVKVAGYARRLLTVLRSQPGPFTYQEVGEVSSRPDVPGARPERRAWLGTIPDFTEQTRGVKLAGVIDGSPADSVGLTKGDILLGIGGKLVADLAEFGQQLRSHEPGERVPILISREGRHQVFEVILADRRDR
jgi:hypothetical protein